MADLGEGPLILGKKGKNIEERKGSSSSKTRSVSAKILQSTKALGVLFWLCRKVMATF